MSLEEAANSVAGGDHVGPSALHDVAHAAGHDLGVIRANEGPHHLALDNLDGGRTCCSHPGVSKHVITSWFTQASSGRIGR